MTGKIPGSDLEWLSCRLEGGSEELVLALKGSDEGYSMQDGDLVKLINIDLANGVKVRSSVTEAQVRFQFDKPGGVGWTDIVDRKTLKYTKLVSDAGKPYEGHGMCIHIEPRPFKRKF